MNIEVVAFYPEKFSPLCGGLNGTLHIYLPDMGLEFRGIIVSKRKDHWFFGFPTKSNFDLNTKEKVFYTCASFRDTENYRIFRSALHDVGKAFIEEHFLSDPVKLRKICTELKGLKYGNCRTGSTKPKK